MALKEFTGTLLVFFSVLLGGFFSDLVIFFGGFVVAFFIIIIIHQKTCFVRAEIWTLTLRFRGYLHHSGE